MIYRDRIYGKVEITQPVILELIKSPSFKRLKGIDQVGYLSLYSKLHSQKIEKLTRFEHSLGVFILLKKFKASFEEQIASLLHDISHGVFSHAIDYALKEGSEKDQSFQDKIFEKFFKKSEIPSILKKHNFDPNYFLKKENFPLLEKELPDLCADRIDYSLRSAVCNKIASKKEIDYFLENLSVEQNIWVFKNFRSAKKYANLFLKLNRIYWAGFSTAVMFCTIGKLLSYALNKKYITKGDLFTTDREILRKIKSKFKSDKKLKLFFNRMIGKTKIKNSPKNYDIIIYCKSRIVDPYFKDKNKIKRLSQVNRNWRKIVKQEIKPKKYCLKF
jgi:hypothetical protein